MQHLTKALINPETTKIRSFREFKIEADKINKWYSKTALNTEYNTAIAGAQMASKWVEIQEQGDPMLEFDAVMDGQTTDLCRSLNGVTLPSSDPFWQQYYPPNHFSCRSTVRISYGRTPTDHSTIVYPEKMPAMFKTNLAKTGVIFPPNHAYWKNIPEEELNRALTLRPYDHQFSEVVNYGKGHIRIHPLLNKSENDYESVYQIAKQKALLGHKIDILPTHQYDDIVRDILFYDAKKGKSIDLRIDGILWEVERSTNSLNINNLKHAVGAGSRQCDNVIVALSQGIDEHTLTRVSKGRFIDHKDLKIIEYQYGENFVTHKREEFLK